MTVPEEVSCYSKIQAKSIEAYKAYQNQKCNVQLQEAKTQIASNNYNGALNTLSQIDPSTPCFKESQTLVSNASAKVDAEEKKQWELKMKVYNDNVALEKERINAIKEIAAAYYKSKPTTVNYSYIVK
jgi:chaperonin cofactor prefoldin